MRITEVCFPPRCEKPMHIIQFKFSESERQNHYRYGHELDIDSVGEYVMAVFIIHPKKKKEHEEFDS